MTATADLAIRARRAAFNHAIAEGNAAAIGPLLTRDCVMITGTDSALITGRNAQVKVWQREFTAAHRLIYVRMPETILVSEVEPVALEQGRWHGSERDAKGSGDAYAASGTYAAKWREIGNQWVIEAEIFVTMS